MNTKIKSKFFDGLLSAVIIMAIMYPLFLMLHYLSEWGTSSYWVAAIIFTVAATWMLYRATLEKLSKVGSAWYGIVGGFFAWIVIEINQELGMINFKNSDILIVLLLFIAFLDAVWKYFPTGAKFWIIAFMMNWIGPVIINVGKTNLAGSALTLVFTASAAAFGLLIVGLIYWIFAHTSNRVQRLWAGLWIWWSLLMIDSVMR